MKKILAKTVINAIGNSKLKLYQGPGYWYFVYDDIPNNVFESKSVMVMRLNDMPLKRWIETGQDFIEKMTEKN